MRRESAPRRLTVDGTVWLWNVRHRHPDCRTVLSLRRTEHPHAQLRLVFRDGPGRIVAGYPFGLGDVASTGGAILNLNKPGVVRRFLEEAATRGLLPTVHGIREENAWPLYDTVADREAGAGAP
ncbi:hypothetical protein AB0F25_16675 [Streptomyces wedmorensis]|uniref:Uncharacterized protein n=2 Tax=Streptomyces TaxID=1883 RepID=A0A0L8JVW6_STRVR|nr:MULTISPECIES: hypothetical protein [Streptomyces]KOG17846.1 hypothetical protein ADK34_25470 [Streptomyces viridochromogenes]